MKKYRVKYRVTEANRCEHHEILVGAEITVELEAPHEQAAEYRAWLLFANNARLHRDGDGLELIEVSEVCV